MARPKKQPNPETRHAFDGPQVDDDELINFIADRNREDGARASDVGKSRAEIGQFLEKTGINKKAFAWGRQIMKQKKSTDQADIIRSLKFMLPKLETHLLGNQGEMFPEPLVADEREPLEPFTDDLPGSASNDEEDGLLAELPDEPESADADGEV